MERYNQESTPGLASVQYSGRNFECGAEMTPSWSTPDGPGPICTCLLLVDPTRSR